MIGTIAFAYLFVFVVYQIYEGAIWRQRSGSALAQVKVCCLMALIHYLNKCWLPISVDLWNSPESNLMANAPPVIVYDEFENCTFKITSPSTRGQPVKRCRGYCKVIVFYSMPDGYRDFVFDDQMILLMMSSWIPWYFIAVSVWHRHMILHKTFTYITSHYTG